MKITTANTDIKLEKCNALKFSFLKNWIISYWLFRNNWHLKPKSVWIQLF